MAKGLFDELGGQFSDGYKKWFGEGSPWQKAGSNMGMGPGDHSKDKAANDLINKIIQNGQGLNAPTLNPVALEHQSYGGDVNPGHIGAAQAGVADAGPTHMNEVSTDPRLREAQMRALSSMQGVADSGGMTSADTANMRRMQSQVGGDDAGRRNAIMQGMQQRGLGGSGMELLNQLTSAQGSTDREAQQGLDVQGMAQQRALQAMQGAGSMSGSLRDQDFSQQARAKEAQDSIDKFNTQGRNQNSQFNAGFQQQGNIANAQMGMQAGLANRAGRQEVLNANTGINNQQNTTNTLQVPQQNFANQGTAVAARQNSYIPGVNYYSGANSAMQAEKGNKAGAVVGGIGAVVGGIYGGPAGAAAGGAAGKKVGTSMAGGDQNQQSQDGTAYAAFGGKIPGIAPHHGDTMANDSVPTMLSPGEVVLPRSIAAHPSAVPNFMHMAHSLDPAKNKEAMLSALKNLHKRAV